MVPTVRFSFRRVAALQHKQSTPAGGRAYRESIYTSRPRCRSAALCIHTHMLYATSSARYLRYMEAAESPEDASANEVLSAHSTIASLVSLTRGTAVFGVKHYLRYAQLSLTHGDPPQKEWSIAVGRAAVDEGVAVDGRVGLGDRAARAASATARSRSSRSARTVF